MATVNKLKQLLEEDKKALGFLPTSGSVKPIHIANGLFRSCLQRYCNIRPLHEWITSERRKDGKISSSGQLLQEYKELFNDAEQESEQQLSRVRLILERIFDQDKASYPSFNDTVINISSMWMINDTVKSEYGIGELIYNCLAYEANGKQSEGLRLLEKALRASSDDLSRLAQIIIKSDKTKEQFQRFNKSPISFIPNKGQIRIRKAFDQLAENIVFTKQNEIYLPLLKRFVNLACFSAIHYLIQANSDINNLKPALIVFDAGGELTAVEQASEECLVLAKKAVEDYYASRIAVYLEKQMGFSEAEIIDFVRKMPLGEEKSDSEKKNNAEIREEIMISYKNNYADSGDRLLALSQALQQAAYNYAFNNCTPSDFCGRGLSVRTGLVGPEGNAAKRKRFLVNRYLLETLVLSVLTKKQLSIGVTIRELGDYLREKFNIIFGSNIDLDYKLLKDYGIAERVPGDLRNELFANSKYISNMLISMKLAKQHADGVTIVGWEE